MGEILSCFLFMIIILSLNINIVFTSSSNNDQLQTKTYIVQMEKSAMPAQTFIHHKEWYASTIKSVIINHDSEAENRVIYTYDTAFHGVAARLTEQEAERLNSQHGVISIFPETIYQLHTTRSPTFLGLEKTEHATGNNVWPENLGNHDQVIIGVLDTGIWPESPSFNDTGMKPVPSSWKGACETGRAFETHHCNKKIIGARVFYHGYEASYGKINEQDEYKSPRDQDGHGTHTAATAAGSPVSGANLLGYAAGTARGMAPHARLAAYKVCWTGGCFSSDIIFAVDRAVADGVNVLSISLGGGVSAYYRDSLSIAAFGAMEKGVFVSCSAGNGGPNPISLTNVSPWIATVGASTMDRDFPATVKLGTGKTTAGVSLYKGRINLSTTKQYPLVYKGSNASSPDPTSLCLDGTLDRRSVAGKIVICDRGISPRVQKGQVVKDAGGVGMILSNTEANGEELVGDCHLIPTVAIGEKEGIEIKRYALTNRNATATLAFLGTKLGIRPSPVVAAFSSRGPNLLTLEIMKPDIIAPGVNILAAWTGDAGPSGLPTDRRRLKFNILSGTSMSCPHVSGIAALLKGSHPDWSPAAIKSALMTTAYVHDNTQNPLKDASTDGPSDPYVHGSGHVNPVKALDPGLVYDISPQDYLEFLCAQKLTPGQLKVFAKFSNRTCRHSLANPGDLNYPALSVVFSEDSRVSEVTLHRTVTNVGPAVSHYHVEVSQLKGVVIDVEPRTLNFTRKYEKIAYKIRFTTKLRQVGPQFGDLIWKDNLHFVRSPVIITWLSPI
ncbi:subtilisin-like protease SBT1.3 [Impatiens glandulifera]|uniref:subtilisin-like protease SBT1.3 n=1 Tax=Impatiens glandulifera TaxID=253017 RepID=UPI001FB101D7|nr:subtilisin-like protease SBT1.3 [Impatiens glandulifera]